MGCSHAAVCLIDGISHARILRIEDIPWLAHRSAHALDGGFVSYDRLFLVIPADRAPIADCQIDEVAGDVGADRRRQVGHRFIVPLDGVDEVTLVPSLGVDETFFTRVLTLGKQFSGRCLDAVS